jgi:hypothetical protein
MHHVPVLCARRKTKCRNLLFNWNAANGANPSPVLTLATSTQGGTTMPRFECQQQRLRKETKKKGRMGQQSWLKVLAGIVLLGPFKQKGPTQTPWPCRKFPSVEKIAKLQHTCNMQAGINQTEELGRDYYSLGRSRSVFACLASRAL